MKKQTSENNRLNLGAACCGRLFFVYENPKEINGYKAETKKEEKYQTQDGLIELKGKAGKGFLTARQGRAGRFREKSSSQAAVFFPKALPCLNPLPKQPYSSIRPSRSEYSSIK